MTATPLPPRRSVRGLLGWLLVLALVVSGCAVLRSSGPREAQDRVSIEQGRDLIQEYGCGKCHTIPGVRGADGLVGPPLTQFSHRGFIAGRLANTPENLARWIANPQEVDPETAMPDLGVTADEAENIAAYLHSLK